MKIKHLVAGLVVTAACACASTPKVNYTYYPPKATGTARAVITLACDTKDKLFWEAAGTISVSHAADTSNAKDFSLGKGAGVLTNGDYTVQFYPDQRLRGVNSAETGRLGEAITAIGQLGTTLLSFAKNDTKEAMGQTKLCGEIDRRLGGPKKRGETVTVTYSGSLSNFSSKEKLDRNEGNLDIDTFFHEVRVVYSEETDLQFAVIAPDYFPSGSGTDIEPAKKQGTPIELPIQKQIRISIVACLDSKDRCMDQMPIASITTIIASETKFKNVFIPKTPRFGSQSFELAVTETGAIGSIGYATTGGFSSAIGGLNTILSATQGPTTQEQADAIAAEANLIQQQQRLIRCRMDSQNCGS